MNRPSLQEIERQVVEMDIKFNRQFQRTHTFVAAMEIVVPIIVVGGLAFLGAIGGFHAL